MKPILGIDLGTTKCVACVRLGSECVEIPPETDGPYAAVTILPSVFIDAGKRGIHVGEEVNRKYSDATYGPQVVRNVKRFMWREKDNGRVPAKRFRFESQSYTPAQISSHYLRRLKAAAERETDRLKARPSAQGLDWSNWLDAVVVTVPAYFGPEEKDATKDAALLAGFLENGIELLSEPVAAALAWQVNRPTKRELILVVDLGGGTCDLTLLATGPEWRELGYFGDNQFGGLEWDLSIAETALRKSSLSERLRHLLGADGLPDYSKYGDWFNGAELVKKGFCRDPQKKELGVNVSGGRPNESVKISRQEFHDLSDGHARYCGRLADLLIASIDPDELGWRSKRALRWSDIDQILLVGGGSLIPHVHEVFQERWNRKIRPIESPQMAVARGAAVYGQLRSQGKRLSGVGKPRCLHDIGIVTDPERDKSVSRRRWFFWQRSGAQSNGHAQPKKPKFSVILKRNTPLPKVVKRPFRVPRRELRELLIEISRKRYTRGQPQGFEENLEDVQRVDLSTLEPPQDEADDTVTVSMEFDDRQKLRIVTTCRGKSEEIVLDRGDFDRAKRAK